MARIVLDTLGTKKLAVFVVTLLLCLITCFLVGSLIAPAPYSTIVSADTACVDRYEGHHKSKKVFIPRGNGSCVHVTNVSLDPRTEEEEISANQIAISQWLPLPGDDTRLQMSRWFQTMQTFITMRVENYRKNPPRNDTSTAEDKKPELMVDSTLYHRDASDGDLNWTELASAKVHRHLDCILDDREKFAGTETSYYKCQLLPFFELGSVHYNFYLINILIPVLSWWKVNQDIGRITAIRFITIVQNGRFTKVWFSLKTVLFPLTLAALVWFWRRVRQLARPANLLERTLFSLGIVLSIMNFPMEWLTLWADVPVMLLLNDIRQVAFYAMLLSFWLIFVGEHMPMKSNKLQAYWKRLTAVIGLCSALLIFDISKSGVPLSNPFNNQHIFSPTAGRKTVVFFVTLAFSYFWFLFFRAIHASCKNVRMSSRSKCLMLAILLCAALTASHFYVTRMSQGLWAWGGHDLKMTYVSGLLTGVYGMWNIHTIGLLCLYAPLPLNRRRTVTGTAGCNLLLQGSLAEDERMLCEESSV